jgi:hypothetical protein
MRSDGGAVNNCEAARGGLVFGIVRRSRRSHGPGPLLNADGGRGQSHNDTTPCAATYKRLASCADLKDECMML